MHTAARREESDHPKEWQACCPRDSFLFGADEMVCLPSFIQLLGLPDSAGDACDLTDHNVFQTDV